jgi:hypothetical protein
MFDAEANANISKLGRSNSVDGTIMAVTTWLDFPLANKNQDIVTSQSEREKRGSLKLVLRTPRFLSQPHLYARC